MSDDLFWIGLGLASETGNRAANRKKQKRTAPVEYEYAYELLCNFNKKRQKELTEMALLNTEKFEEVLGHPIFYNPKYNKKCVGYFSKRDAIREIMEREGFRYYDEMEFNNDPHIRTYRGQPIINHSIQPMLRGEQLNEVEKKAQEMINSQFRIVICAWIGTFICIALMVLMAKCAA